MTGWIWGKHRGSGARFLKDWFVVKLLSCLGFEERGTFTALQYGFRCWLCYHLVKFVAGHRGVKLFYCPGLSTKTAPLAVLVLYMYVFVLLLFNEVHKKITGEFVYFNSIWYHRLFFYANVQFKMWYLIAPWSKILIEPYTTLSLMISGNIMRKVKRIKIKSWLICYQSSFASWWQDFHITVDGSVSHEYVCPVPWWQLRET